MEKTLHQVLLVLVRSRAEAFMSGCQIGVSIARELDYATPFFTPSFSVEVSDRRLAMRLRRPPRRCNVKPGGERGWGCRRPV